MVTGAGKVGSEHGRPGVPFPLSQRADFVETLAGSQDKLERLAAKALQDYRAGKTKEMGFDEL